MRRVYLIPNIITAFGLACGLFVIFKMNMIEPGAGTYQVLHSATLLLLLAAFADFLDGAVARIIHAESEFGFMFDSLSDAVTFGVAPSVVLLKSLSLEQGTLLSFYAILGALLFSLCGVLRLVRFNVMGNLEKQKTASSSDGKVKIKHFTGLPIPAGAITVVATDLLLRFSPLEQWLNWSASTQAWVLVSAMIVVGYLMISRWKFPSLKILQVRVPSLYLILFTVVLAIVILYGILYFMPVILSAMAWGYILVSLTIALIRLMAGRKSKTLAEFEPESDDQDSP